MRNLIIFLILFNVLFSCNSFKDMGLKGIYEKQATDYLYSLMINSDDNSFLLSKKYYEANSSCRGTWVIRKDSLILKCYKEEFPAQITSGYMNKREFKVLILNSKELMLDDIVLIRKESDVIKK